MRASFRQSIHSLLFALTVVWSTAAGCSSNPDSSALKTQQDAAQTDAEDAVATADQGISEESDSSQHGSADIAAECPGGVGCSCDQNDDCDTSFCLEGSAGRRCAATCTASCQPGFRCTLVDNGADTSTVCISAWARLCNPCGDNKDCRYLGIDNARCLDRGEAGGYCGVACTTDGDDCPAGYGCKSIQDLDGNSSKQCVPTDAAGKLRQCQCSKNAVERAAKTTCYKTLVVNEKEMSCSGEAQCKQSNKVATCVAKEPAKEVCDGVDNDCDGATDEAGCDDKNPCTVDTCDPSEGCRNVALVDGIGCEADNSVCTQNDACKAGKCVVGTLISCDDKNPCTLSKCDAKTGCVQSDLDGKVCEDGNACTLGDSCNKAACVSGKAKICNAIQGCSKGVCDPTKGGACTFGSKVDGTACDDGSVCSTGDVCTKGQCVGAAINCDDNNPCTTDSCKAVGGCQYAVNTAPCDDGDGCTVADSCAAKVCVAGKKKSCDDGNPCTQEACSKGVCSQSSIADKTPCTVTGGANVPGGGAPGGGAAGAKAAGLCQSGVCTVALPSPSCAALHAKDPAAKDGVYSIDPDGKGPVAAVKVFCHMSLGGWTLVGNYYDSKDDDMPNTTDYITSGWQRTAPGVWSKGATVVARTGDAVANAAVGLAFVAALRQVAGQQHLKICLVHKDGSDAVCRSSFAGSLTLAAYAGGNPRLGAYKSDPLVYSFGRLAGLAGGADGYTSFQPGKFGLKRTPGQPGEFGFDAAGLVEKSEDPDCLGDGGPWHGSGCGISYRPHRVGFDELSTASCCLIGGGHPVLTSYGFRIYVGPAPTLGSLNTPARSCQQIVDKGASLGDGRYWLDLTGQGKKAVQLSCLMSAAGGGWTQLADAVAKTLQPGSQRAYLLNTGVRWYRSPQTTLIWSWSKGQELVGTWAWFNGKKASTFQCLGSAEKPGFGVGCSAGGSQKAKVLPSSAAGGSKSAVNATLTVCQPFPDAFGGGGCVDGVGAWVR